MSEATITWRGGRYPVAHKEEEYQMKLCINYVSKKNYGQDTLE